MSWRDLLQKTGETKVFPWIGGDSYDPVRTLYHGDRVWFISGRLPPEPGWYEFKLSGKKAEYFRSATVADGPGIDYSCLQDLVHGYLIGDRILVDGTSVNPEPSAISEQSDSVHLVEPGLDRFARIVAGRTHESGNLIFIRQDFPLGPEDEVLVAFRNKAISVSHIKAVTPALDAAFRMESWQRIEVERRRFELARLRAEEEARLAIEERRNVLAQQLGTGVGRRQMATIDFAEAARSALAAGGAVYLDHRQAPRKDEMIVSFKIDRRQFECVCDAKQLSIIDSGICLTGHTSGIKYDDRFTLESLPSVIREAIREGKLVVYRHVGDEEDYDEDD